MKKVLTIGVLKNADLLPDELLFEGAEIIKVKPDESSELYFKRLFKAAEGKYLMFADGRFTLYDFYALLCALEKASADAVTFEGGLCLKISTVKSAQYKGFDKTCAELAGLFESKSVATLNLLPLAFAASDNGYSDDAENCVKAAIDGYAKSRSKLNKDVYSLCFDTVSDRVADFYADALLAVRAGKLEPEKLSAFNDELKKHTVLYLAVDKRLDLKGGLKAVADSGFKISGGIAKKLSK